MDAHEYVHVDVNVPVWIAELLIAKVDDESMRLHALNQDKDQILPDGTIIHSEIRRKANQLGALKNALVDRWRASRGLGVMPNTRTHTNLSHSHGSSASHSSAGGASATIHDRAGLYVAIVALAVALYAFGQQSYLNQVIDAKVQAGMAAASRDMQAEVARANATAHSAETHARVALDKVETAETELGKKGINIRTDGH